MAAACLFCKIVAKQIPAIVVHETKHTLAFMDIGPISKGHCLVIPKEHAAKLHDVSDECLAEIGPVLKKIANAGTAEDYNVLQNNGKLAHQEVQHVHFHFIPKPDEKQGLVMEWPTMKIEKEELQKIADEMKNKISA